MEKTLNNLLNNLKTNKIMIFIGFGLMIFCIIGIISLTIKRDKEFDNYCKWIASDWNETFKKK